TLVWGISPRQPSGKNIIRWLLKKRTNGSVRYCQYTSGKFIAVGLTDILESSGLSGIPAFVGLALLSSFLCMFIASGSAIWSILAPIFVPMFMLLGFHPAFAQILFRIADSSVLPLAPVSPFVPLFLGFLQRYKPDAKLGTYYSLVLPYPLIFLVVWLLMLLAWYLVGLPIGPGIYPRLS
ncbi:AbgT family transporter, partial [Shigella sonnei]